MAFVIPPAVWGVGAGLGLAGLGWKAYQWVQESHPLVQAEKLAWVKDHNLLPDAHLRATCLPLLEGCFQLGSQVKLCYLIVDGEGLRYEHWFVTDGTWYLEFGNGVGLTRHKVTLHTNPKSGFLTVAIAIVDDSMRGRMEQVVGATNYSLLLRNCEHVANYVVKARWLSMQTVREGTIAMRLLDFMVDKQQKALRNTLPSELAAPATNLGNAIVPGQQGYIKFSNAPQVLNTRDRECFNVVFIGPTGSGKSSLINLLFNKRVAETSDDRDYDALSCTKDLNFYAGTGDCRIWGPKANRTINVIDTIGFCDSELSAQEVYNIIKDKIQDNCTQVHRVVVCTSGRIERNHRDAIKKILGWLNFNPQPHGDRCVDPVIFLYTKADTAGRRDSPERRQNNVVAMVDSLGAVPRRLIYFNDADEPQERELNFAVGFPDEEKALDLPDFMKLGVILFDVPMRPIQVDRSSCAIL